MSREIKVEIYIYIVSDPHGNLCYDVCVDSSDTITIHSIYDEKGEYLNFESDAYHLERWCEKNGLGYTEKKTVLDCAYF